MKLRVSAIQYHLHTINNFQEFEDQVTHYVKAAAEFNTDFILFPEFKTTNLEDEESHNYGVLIEWKNPFKCL